MNYIERVSGSIQHEKQYNNALKKVQQIDKIIQDKSDSLKDLNKEKRIININMVQFEGAQSLFEQQDKINKDLFDLNIALYIKQIMDNNSSLTQNQ